VPEPVATLGHGALVEAAHDSEQAIRKVARRLVELDAERQRVGAQAVRESIGAVGVEGAGPRSPNMFGVNGHAQSVDLLARMGISGSD